MKAISIRQPWAEKIACGDKTIETRLWKTAVRGDILLVASASPKISGIPSGCAVCVAELVNCHPMTEADETAACCAVYEGAYSWELRNVRRVKNVPIKGRLRFYDVPDEIIEFI